MEADEIQAGSGSLILQPSFSIKPLLALLPPSADDGLEVEAPGAAAGDGRKRAVAGRGAGVSFLVRLPDEPGKLDAAKAAQLGLCPPRPPPRFRCCSRAAV